MVSFANFEDHSFRSKLCFGKTITGCLSYLAVAD
jgi:hypothetical protein